MNVSDIQDKIALWRSRPDIMVRDPAIFGAIPDPQQEEVLQAFPHKQRLCMKASKGCGKAQPLSLELYTPQGRKRFGDLKVGDEVFAVDGSVTKILAVHHQGILPTYRVVFDDGSSTECCGDHLWKVQGATERRKKIGWSIISTDQIIARGVRNKNGRWAGRQFEIPNHGAAEFPRKYLTADPYVLGVWIADGCSTSGTYCDDNIAIDREIEKRGYRVTRRGDGRGNTYMVTVHEFAGQLRELGIINLRSYERFIPEAFKTATVEDRRDLLAALMDTDGYIADEGHMEYGSTSLRLALDVVDLVRSLGGCSWIKDGVKKPFYRKNGKNIQCRDFFRISLAVPFNPFKASPYIGRWKQPVNKSQTRYLTRYIDRIDKSADQECMCIEVDHPSHCYLTNDFIVTHNTTTEAWCIWNFLLTRPNPKIACCSITSDNLSDNLWSELALWQNKSPLLQKLFTWTKTRIVFNEEPETWFCSARTWSKSANKDELGQTLAGLHSDYIFFVLDESGGMPDEIMVSADAALSTGIESHIMQAGNPIMLSGPLYRACTQERRLWFILEMTGDPDNPKRSPRVNLQWAKDQIEKYGCDNPWVLVNVFGKFPPASLNSLIGPDEVTAAMKRDYREQDYGSSARILGIDVALFGDDASVVFPRQGLQAFNPLIYRNIDGTTGANLTAAKWKEWDADACFVDNTGGFGSSWCDNLRRLGYAPIPVHFAEKPQDGKFFNKRAEMMFGFVEWIKAGGALPPNQPELLAALTQTTYTFKNDKLMIEPKEVIKEKLGYSPDVCFVAGTMISTTNGKKPIESIKVGDFVDTPLGPSRVIVTGQQTTDQLATISFSNKSTLTGTPSHRIFVWEAGQRSLDALSLTNECVSKGQWRFLWMILRLLYTMEKSIGFKQLVVTISREITVTPSAFCIAAFGQTVMALYQKATLYITKTMIGATTIPTIWKLSFMGNTQVSIWLNGFLTQKTKRNPLKIWKESDQKPVNGIVQPRAENGIVSMAEEFGLIERNLMSNAGFVEKHSKRHIPVARRFVHGNVGRKAAMLAKRLFAKLANGAGKIFWLINTGGFRVVPVSVLTESVELTSVYNLSLERHNAYYANDILVFNCDAAMLTFAAPVIRAAKGGKSRFTSSYDPLASDYIEKN